MQKTFWRESLNLVYPPLCVACGERVLGEGVLCASCWRQIPFLSGAMCRLCAQPLPGPPTQVPCDACLRVPPLWTAGAAALSYGGLVPQLALRLKLSGQTHLAKPFAQWLLPALLALEGPPPLVVPVPLHWTRLLRRGFNQAALLARHLARGAGFESCVDALARPQATPRLEGLLRAERLAALKGAICPHRPKAIKGRHVVVVDDVFTSGATFATCAEALFEGGAAQVSVLALARVVKAS